MFRPTLGAYLRRERQLDLLRAVRPPRELRRRAAASVVRLGPVCDQRGVAKQLGSLMAELHRAQRRRERVAFAGGQRAGFGADIVRQQSRQRMCEEPF